MIKDIKPVFTIGHGTRTLEEFIAILEEDGIQCVVDVRSIPRSRHNPQFNEDSLPSDLGTHVVEYLHMSGLGGLRHTHKDSLNTGWKNLSFRGFADYMATEEFAESLDKLVMLSHMKRIVLMCAETLPWRCHRSLIADALTIRGIPVWHLFKAGKMEEHRLTPWAQVDGRRLLYLPLGTAIQEDKKATE
ncbi:MAG: DUF488 domain-containing protein [Nitrospiraceae bacterium]|nr:DUF488 domain-containing protein [Nitrospiraceae bacterium]